MCVVIYKLMPWIVVRMSCGGQDFFEQIGSCIVCARRSDVRREERNTYNFRGVSSDVCQFHWKEFNVILYIYVEFSFLQDFAGSAKFIGTMQYFANVRRRGLRSWCELQRTFFVLFSDASTPIMLTKGLFESSRRTYHDWRFKRSGLSCWVEYLEMLEFLQRSHFSKTP